MPTETATYVSDLDSAKPVGGESRTLADDYLRLIKQVLQNTFPQANAAINATPAQMNFLVGVTDAIQTQIDGKEPTITKNTGFNLALGTTAGTVSEGNHNHDLVYEAIGTCVKPTDYATSTVGGTLKARLSGTTLYLTNNGVNA